MTPTSAPDLPDIDKVLQMTKDMELISDFLTNGRFVGDRVHVSIEHLADCIRNRLPSEASALATPVGWRPIETAPKDGVGVLVRDYYRTNGQRYEDGRLQQTGPDGFGIVVARYDETHGWHVAASVTNNKYIVLINPTHWQPLPAPPHTEERG